MGKTAISWTATVLSDGTTLPGYSFNPWIGCTKVSQGCAHCYAETQNKRYNWTPDGWGVGAPRKLTSEKNWQKPIAWAKQAKAEGVVRRVFCASLADVFDAEVDWTWRARLWDLIEETAQIGGLEWLLLTKRPENILEMLPKRWLANPPDYIRLGVTVEDQANEYRIGELLKVWGGKNFVSVEPMLSPVDLHLMRSDRSIHILKPIPHFPYVEHSGKYKCMIHWVIVGGESGAGCRPMELEWARDLLRQCREADIPYFFKQVGGHPDKRHDPAGWPEDLRVQEFPEVQS